MPAISTPHAQFATVRHTVFKAPKRGSQTDYFHLTDTSGYSLRVINWACDDYRRPTDLSRRRVQRRDRRRPLRRDDPPPPGGRPRAAPRQQRCKAPWNSRPAFEIRDNVGKRPPVRGLPWQINSSGGPSFESRRSRGTRRGRNVPITFPSASQISVIERTCPSCWLVASSTITRCIDFLFCCMLLDTSLPCTFPDHPAAHAGV